MTNEILEAVAVVEGKGDPYVIVGTTGSGKSTAMVATAEGETVQQLLSLREASGKGSTAEISLIATDYEAIPDDKLIMTAKLRKPTIADCGDDNDFLGGILYRALKACKGDAKAANYKQEVECQLNTALINAPNDSLAYKLRSLLNTGLSHMVDILASSPPDNTLKVIYDEMVAHKGGTGADSSQKFIELLSKRESLKCQVQSFWEYVVEILEQDRADLCTALSGQDAVLVELEDETIKFTITLSDDTSEEILGLLLQSEYGSKEYLFSDISLIYRGASYLFDMGKPSLDFLTVSELDGVAIHCVKFIDTQGLFHKTGVKSHGEASRIIDILSSNHTNKLILVVSADVTATVKNGYEAICTMLQGANRELDVHILYTHWDEHLSNCRRKNTEKRRFSKISNSTWADTYKKAVECQESLAERFKDSLDANNCKKKPRIMGSYRAAIVSDSGGYAEEVLEANGINYPSALCKLIAGILAAEAGRGWKHKVRGDIERCFSIPEQTQQTKNVTALYTNLVCDCKGLKLYASTVRACTRKWLGFGGVHQSMVYDNHHGFNNITTSFVQEIRNYAQLYTKGLTLDVAPAMSDPTEAERLAKDLMAYLNGNQMVGREVAKMIGGDAYKNGFSSYKGFRYQYDRFSDMLQYTQDTYFMSENIPLTEEFHSLLTTTIKTCIKEFVNARCIEVY